MKHEFLSFVGLSDKMKPKLVGLSDNVPQNRPKLVGLSDKFELFLWASLSGYPTEIITVTIPGKRNRKQRSRKAVKKAPCI